MKSRLKALLSLHRKATLHGTSAHDQSSSLIFGYVQGVDLLMMQEGLPKNDPEHYFKAYRAFRGAFLTAFMPEKSGLYQFSTCYNITNVETGVDVWSGETMEPIASTDSKGYDCAELEAVPMQAGKPYFAFLRSQRKADPLRQEIELLAFSVSLVEEAAL